MIQKDAALPALQWYNMGLQKKLIVGFSCHLYLVEVSGYLIVEALRLSPTCSRL